LCTFTLESTHFVFNLCPMYTHDGASAKFSTNSQESDYSVRFLKKLLIKYIKSKIYEFAKYFSCSLEKNTALFNRIG
jgi:hypothetical protein